MKKDGNKLVFLKYWRWSGTQSDSKYGYVKDYAAACEDKIHYWAQNRISDNKVIVWSGKVKNPVAARYGSANSPIKINLINGDGLLASPFRTDQWKGITEKE